MRNQKARKHQGEERFAYSFDRCRCKSTASTSLGHSRQHLPIIDRSMAAVLCRADGNSSLMRSQAPSPGAVSMLMTIDRRSSLLGWISPGEERDILWARPETRGKRLDDRDGPLLRGWRGSYGREKEREGKGDDRRFADSAES